MADVKHHKTQLVLTDLDRRIIAELERDPLISSQTIADHLGVTRSQVLTRLGYIEANQVVQVIAQINSTYGGHVMSHASIKVADRSVASVAKELSDLTEVQFVAGLLGEEDLLAVIRLHPSHPHSVTFDKLSNIPGVVGIRYELVLRVLHSKANKIAFSRMLSPASLEERKIMLAQELESLGLDDLDLSIIAELGQNARKSIRAIARDKGVTEGAIRYRVRNLQSKGLLSIVTAIDAAALGLTTWALLEIEAEPNELADLVAQLSGQDWVQYLVLMTGASSLRCTALTSDQEELGEVIEWTRAQAAVRRVSPRPMLHFHKLDRRWGGPASV